MATLDHFPQLALAVFLLCVMAAPPGWLFLCLMHLPTGRNMIPVAVITGVLIVPLVFSLAAAVLSGLLTLPARIGVWAALNGVLLGANKLARLTTENTGSPLQAARKRQLAALVGVALVSMGIAGASLVTHDTKSGARWKYISLYDWDKHIGIGTALAIDDHLPPANPFLSIDPHLRYYYFSYVLPGMLRPMVGLTVANSMIAMALLIAFCFPFLLYHFGCAVGLTPGAALMAASLTVLVSGLDIFYNVKLRCESGYWPDHVDGWMPFELRRIDSLSILFLWTFQHSFGIAAVILILWVLQQSGREWLRMVGVALLLSALAGTSSIVWVAGVVGVAALGVVELVIWIPHRKSPRARFVLPLSGLALSLVLSAPYFHLMAGSDLSVAPVIRITPTRQGLIYGSVFGHFFGPRWWTYVLDFPFQMVPEFGLVLLTGAAGLWCARQQWTRHYEIRQCALMVVVCFLLVLVVREGRNVNDYAPRIAGVAWTLLGVASGFWWMARRRHALWRRRLLRGLLLIFLVSGLATTLYEPLMVQTSSARVGVEHHELFEWLNTHTGRQDVFLLDHQTPGEVMLFVQRRTALSYKDLSTIYSSRLSLYGEAVQTIEKAYVESDPALAARDFQAVEVDYLVLSWRSALACESNALFTAYFIPVFQNRLYRVFWVNVSP